MRISPIRVCRDLRWALLPVWLLVLSSASLAQSLTADDIMARVGANQDAAIAMRSHYVYKQHIHTTSHQTSGRLMREETCDYDIFPTATASERKLTAISGRYWKKGKYLTYDREPIPDEGTLDADLTHGLIDDSDKREGKEGYLSNLFPLTSQKQKDYKFKLLGEEAIKGRPTYHIAFEPKHSDEPDWSGEAYIDKEEFQPVHVFTKLSRKLPLVARSVLGINLPGIGFNVQYTRQEAGVWFPETFGTEFGIKLFHMWKRNITISLKNSDFKKTHVESKIEVPGSPD